jgi:hypothetical protein
MKARFRKESGFLNFNKKIIFTKRQINMMANIFSIIFVVCKLWNQKI